MLRKKNKTRGKKRNIPKEMGRKKEKNQKKQKKFSKYGTGALAKYALAVRVEALALVGLTKGRVKMSLRKLVAHSLKHMRTRKYGKNGKRSYGWRCEYKTNKEKTRKSRKTLPSSREEMLLMLALGDRKR